MHNPVSGYGGVLRDDRSGVSLDRCEHVCPERGVFPARSVAPPLRATQLRLPYARSPRGWSCHSGHQSSLRLQHSPMRLSAIFGYVDYVVMGWCVCGLQASGPLTQALFSKAKARRPDALQHGSGGQGPDPHIRRAQHANPRRPQRCPRQHRAKRLSAPTTRRPST